MKENKRKIYYFLIVNAILHIFCCVFCFFYNYKEKMEISFSNSLLEFFVIYWCVWNSLLTIIYDLNEIRINRQKNVYKNEKKIQERFAIIVAVSNFTSLLGFSLAFQEVLSRNTFRHWLWLVYTVTWHFLLLPMSLFYFLEFAKIGKKIKKKNLFFLISPLPITFLAINLIRRFLLVKEEYFYLKEGAKFKKFMIWWFSHFEKKDMKSFFLWIVFSLCYFWLTAILLVKSKKWSFFHRKKNSNTEISSKKNQ